MFFWDFQYKIIFFLSSSFMPHIENHKHKQCWLPCFGCWPRRKSKHQKPSLSDHQKKFFTGQQILAQLLAHRSLHQKIKLASLPCPPLSLPSEWKLGACESLTYFCTLEAKRSWSRISRHYRSHHVWRYKHCQIYNCVLITQLSYPRWRGWSLLFEPA